MPANNVPSLPANAPQYSSKLLRWFGRQLLRLVGWRISGEIANERKVVFAAAPHTSNWDFMVAMMAIVALGVKVSYLMKKEAFFWPFKGLFMALGGIPTDRSAAQDIVSQICGWYEKEEKLWVIITPEGTRSRVEKWKTGFLRVAYEAKIPVALVAWDYPTKTIAIEKLWYPTGDHEKDAEEIRAYLLSKYTGKHPEYQ